MATEPFKPAVTGADVERIARREFQGEELVRTLGLLSSFHLGPWLVGREGMLHWRVLAAVLKLADGSLEALERLLPAAAYDPRELLLRAESPGYRQIEVRIHNGRVPRELQERIVAEDQGQYEAWLAGRTLSSGAPPG